VHLKLDRLRVNHRVVDFWINVTARHLVGGVIIVFTTSALFLVMGEVDERKLSARLDDAGTT
jgi:hypothetical protein